jgi:hypothetical protein
MLVMVAIGRRHRHMGSAVSKLNFTSANKKGANLIG